MDTTLKVPKTLVETVRYFADPDNCLNFLALLRWPDGVAVCPRCGSRESYFLSTRRLWKCKNNECAKQYSVKLGTIFEDSPIALAGCGKRPEKLNLLTRRYFLLP